MNFINVLKPLNGSEVAPVEIHLFLLLANRANSDALRIWLPARGYGAAQGLAYVVLFFFIVFLFSQIQVK